MTIFIGSVRGSGFAKALQTALKAKTTEKVLRVSHAKATTKRKKFLITQFPKDKVEQFKLFQTARISSPRFALTEEEARAIECKSFFARTLVNSTGGKGIVEFERGTSEYPKAPLYTEYIPKKAEYRVHVFNGRVIYIQQKKKKQGSEGNNKIRNLANGYVYCTQDIYPPENIEALAIAAVASLNYSYGAVDIIYNEKRNQCYVLEVNSRPGIEGTTLDKYATAIINSLSN